MVLRYCLCTNPAVFGFNYKWMRGVVGGKWRLEQRVGWGGDGVRARIKIKKISSSNAGYFI